AAAFDAANMDALLLLAPLERTLGYDGRGDYFLGEKGRIKRRPQDETAPYVYAGVAILKPEFFDGSPEGAFPLGKLFDKAEKKARLYGLSLDGTYLHVGSPEAVAAAEEAVMRARG